MEKKKLRRFLFSLPTTMFIKGTQLQQIEVSGRFPSTYGHLLLSIVTVDTE